MRFPLHYIGKVSKFVVSNAMGTVVDTLVLWVCSHFIFADYGYVGEYLVSPLISFECAVFANYLSSWHFVWRDRAKRYGKSTFMRKYLMYTRIVPAPRKPIPDITCAAILKGSPVPRISDA